MNNNYKNQFVNIKQQKLDKERTAFSNCRLDMTDVSFEIGKSSYTAKLFGFIVLFAIFFGGRILARQYVGNPNMTFSVGDIIFWCCIGMIAILVIVTFIHEKNKPTISVLGKKIFYNGNCWTSDDISFVRCTKWFERVEVYSNGKKVLTFPWELDNSELFIAWVNKCGITFEDHRMKAFQ
ncbi:hypothetical protein [Ruminococcus albus]|uniref:Uncharacterized protein n=1 Tax=Ruminococcus albus (strain ATCC 27210 / DSM 20455 / JCM 14654 / NCDO 2250 / 7) TaxID=697329 RepID=E6UHC6_RUMA7|nr:hypothetical protein [Ruminococcus albus]ADU23204.1 hypothetical protein Rumal_2734 [Ruminococcus albus 7 = DSM 20455]